MPPSDPAPLPPDPARPAPEYADAGLGVLVVDDNSAVRRILALALPGAGFSVRLAADGQEAVGVYREHWRDIDLVLLDVLMPGMSGPRTLAALQEINPGVRCCFMSGQTGPYPVHKLLAMGARDLLCKPFTDLEALRLTLRQLARPEGAG